MCGIAGLIGDFIPGLMARMNAVQAHRGPDGQGIFEDPEVIEVMRMKEFKYKEMKRTGRISEIPRAPHGDYDPRVLNSPLQKLVSSGDSQPRQQSYDFTNGNHRRPPT